MQRLTAAIALACLVLAGSTADARPKHATAVQCVMNNDGRTVCGEGGVTVYARAARKGGASVNRSCLTADTRTTLEQAEAHFGVTFKLVSTCRPGARIAGTNHISEHAHGRAVDLLVPRGVSKQAVVRWFHASAKGVTMVYRGMAHVHFDTGPYHALACGGCRVRHTKVARHP